MDFRFLQIGLAVWVAFAPFPDRAQDTVPVTIDTFVRAEVDHYFKERVDQGCLGRFCHDRLPTPVDGQTVIRMNRDTHYSTAIFDLTTPITIIKPDTGKRFQSIVVLNEGHYLMRTIYEPGGYTFTQEEMGTRYIQMTVRTLVNPDDAEDIVALHKAQDAIQVIQDNPGKFEVPAWDSNSLSALRNAILMMTPWVPDSKGMFGRPDQVDPIRDLIGTAAGYGGNREEDAIYLSVTPERNDGQVPHVLTVRDVPVDGFWSVIVYNKDGFFEPPVDSVSVNSVTAKPDVDGAVTIHFGGDPSAPNHLRIMPGWTYMVRLYQPRAEILDGSWVFPVAKVSD